MHPEPVIGADDRVHSPFSMHPSEDPSKCPAGEHYGWKVIDCCGLEPDYNVLECTRCGKQRSVPCDFDEEYD